MAVNAIIAKTVLNFDNKRELYVARAQRGSVITTDKIAKEIAQNTGAHKAQVKLLIESLVENLTTWLEEGHGVRFSGFGTFLPSVRSASSEDPNEAGVDNVHVIFIPSKQLREAMAEVSVTTTNEYKTPTASTTPTDDPTDDELAAGDDAAAGDTEASGSESGSTGSESDGDQTSSGTPNGNGSFDF